MRSRYRVRASSAIPIRPPGTNALLTIHDFANATYEPWPGASEIPEHATWLDAKSPTPEESAFLERALGVKPPSLTQMSEIETSSRLYKLGDAVCVTLPLPHRERD